MPAMANVAGNYDLAPTFLGYSDGDVGVIAGCGISGFGGVVLCEANGLGASRIVFDPSINTNRRSTHGVLFEYDSVAAITISGVRKWTNCILSSAPAGRQDLAEAGPVRIEVFDTEKARLFVESHSGMLEKLGLIIID
jgi:hypothetical protein